MDFSPSPRAAELTAAVRSFVDEHIAPIEEDHQREVARLRSSGGDPWQQQPILDELRARAHAEGLWNLFLPAGHEGPYAQRYGTRGGSGLSNVDYAPVAEAMGRSFLAPFVFNCNAPDSGNAEVLLKYGSPEQQEQWLDPLLEGRIRSAFCMTEPGVASSDATNMELTAVVEGDEVALNGRKWWSTGLGHPDCKILIVMGVSDPVADRHHRHSMVLVPTDTPGVRVERMIDTMGYQEEPFGHGEVSFTDVRVPVENIIAGRGRAFEIAQGRLGPGRVHHCMRLIGLAEHALELACRRGLERVAFGKPLVNLGGNRERVADARIEIDAMRLLVLNAAWKLDEGGPMNALSEVSQIKVAVPNMAQRVIDFAIQIHGGGGMSNDFPLAAAWSAARSLRLADGPDEVHRGLIARLELGKYGAAR
jgi:acyl-CoA dehydrogenase